MVMEHNQPALLVHNLKEGHNFAGVGLEYSLVFVHKVMVLKLVIVGEGLLHTQGAEVDIQPALLEYK